MKITFGPSEPYNSGWRGWSNSVDVFVDSAKIGELYAEHCDQKRYMDYTFRGDPKIEEAYGTISEIGLRAAKKALRAAIARAEGEDQ